MMGGCKRLTIGENGDYPSFQGAWDAMCKEFDVVEGVVIHTHGGKDGLYDTQEATTPILEKGDFGLMYTITGGQK